MTFLTSQLSDDRLRLVDVGARGGIDSRWTRFEGVLDVTAFEPDPEECERLNRSAGSLRYPARFLPYAIWRESTDKVSFHVTNWPVASGMYRPNDEFLKAFPHARGLFDVREERTIAASSLDDVARSEGLAADCLKVDVEGAALDVLLGAEVILRDTLLLEVEVEFNPLFENQRLFADVDRFLREQGWGLVGLRRTSWRRGAQLEAAAAADGGQIVSADALYCNDALIESGLSQSRELKLLVVLGAYLQADAVLARLRTSKTLAAWLSPDELAELERILVPGPSILRRLAGRAVARLGSARRRALADRLQRGSATAWEDPYFF